MATEPIYRLTVYEEDDTTVLFTVSTDPAASDPEKPYLKAPRDYAEQEVDYARGAASIGQVTVEVVDVPTDSADQDTGWLTGLLADANGNSQCNGHRARLTEDFGSGAELIMDGVIRSVTLLGTFSTYSVELRDIRERERKTPAFERTDTPTVLPRGVLNGYGRQVLTLGGFTRYPVPPTRPLRAIYFSNGANVGTLDFTSEIADRRRVTAAVRAALEHTAPLDSVAGAYVFDRWKLLWKPRGSGGPYTEITQLAHTHPSLPSGGGRGWQGEGTGTVRYMRIDNLVSGATLPTDEQDVDVIIQYDGPVSEDWPLHIDGLTVGELLRNAYAGDYSAEDPRIRYDEAALLALTTPVRARFTKPVEDLRRWAEKHAYPIAHAAPTLDSEGRISPTTYLLPDADETVPELGDSNTRPAGGGWGHGVEDSINVVTVSYFEDYLAAETETDEGALIPVADRIRSTEAQHQNIASASVALLGWNEIEIESELLRTVGSPPLVPFFGDIVDQGALQVSKRAAVALLDRFSLGGQYIEIQGLRSDADVESIRVGDYRVLGQSWMPDYLSGTRGLSRLGQCVRRRNINAAWCALTFVDAGSGAAPLGQPTLGTLTADDDGVVTIPVTALASGDPVARVDYAVSATEPSPGSELWVFLDRAEATGDLTTPPLGQGQTVWVRARSEATGRRPSAYTTPDSVTTPAIPRVIQVELETDPDTGIVTVRWEPNESCEGIRLHYERHRSDETPTFPDTDDVDASVGEYVFSGLALSAGDVLTVRLEPFPTWTGSAVSGTAGPIVEVSTRSEAQPEPTVEELTYAFTPSGELVVRVRAAEAGSVRIVADGTDFPTAAEVEGATLRTLDGNGWFELNMGSSFPDVEVFLGSQAYENADGSGAASSLKVSKVAVAEYGLFEGGTIGGWDIDSDSIDATGFSLNSSTRRMLIGAATAVLTGVGIFAGHDGGSDYDFRVGDPAGSYMHWDGSEETLEVVGEITATSGEIGGWSINATDIFSGGISLESDTERILIGSATAPLTGAGVFLGLSGGEYQFRAGDPGGDYLLWDGSALVLSGQIVDSGNLVDGAVDSLQMADEAVIAAKLANYAVGGVKMDGTARSQHGVFMETFESLVTADWTNNGAQGTHSLATGAGVAGGNVFQAVGAAWKIFPQNIPYDPSKIYRMRARIRMTAAPTDPATDVVYIGVSGVAADGSTLINTVGANSQSQQHYVAASGFDMGTVTLNEWHEATGWFSGHGTTKFANGTPNSPAHLYTGARYFRPLFILNYNGGDGTMQLDYIVVDVFDEDGLVRSYLGLNVDGVVAADRVVAASVATGELNATHISSLSFSGKTATFDTGSIGGWVMSAGALSSGDVTIDAANERITMGAASAPLTGIGVFLGLDGSDYEFRVGDPAGEYIHWDGSAFEINAESFTADNPVFDGSVTIEAGAGAERVHLGAVSDGGEIELYNANESLVGELRSLDNGTPSLAGLLLESVMPGGLSLRATGSGSILLDTANHITVTRDGAACRAFTLHKDMTTRTNSGASGEVVLETITVPAGALGALGGIRFRAWGTIAGTNGTRTVIIEWDGVDIFDYPIVAANVGFWSLDVDIHNAAAFDDQRVSVRLTFANGSNGRTENFVSVGGETDLSSPDFDLKVNMASGSDTFSVYGTVMEYVTA